MKEAIETRKKEIEEKKFRSIKDAKESAIKELEDYCSEVEKELPEFKKIIDKYSKKINNSSINDISTLQGEASALVVEERVKRQVRGERDPNTKLDNNALFYGAPRTGKSVMAEKLAYEADMYPLVVIQGSSLTPRKNDYDAADDFNFKREENGEVKYILFIDEANQITTSTLISKSSELTFLKECMGSDSRINERDFMRYAEEEDITNDFPEH
ncbi:8841_t:CDS:2 [Ambispora gerdemannii]|uniref:8841_t:CDS:1 n=1 Tax=Ambispora gerdemannii TaxID=144530 RepID=A0A9N9H856_9GLOM|nr:8841_t:CDS:2 [Ambispora gerdemannii]